MVEQPIPSFYNDLDATREHALRLLSRGVKDRRSAMHTLTIATVGEGGEPHVRTVVNRGFDVPSRTLRFHTDTRSAKLKDLNANTNAAVHIYDARAKIQLRMTTKAQIHLSDALHKSAWEATRPFSRECYRVEPSPGALAEDPEGVPFQSDDDPETGFENFAVVTLQIKTLEWLYLAHCGHRRAQFVWNHDGALKQSWLVP